MAVEIKFDANQGFQRDAIDSVVEVFAGQDGIEQGLTLAGFDDENKFESFQELVFGNTLDLDPETVRQEPTAGSGTPSRVRRRQLATSGPRADRLDLETGEMPLHFSIEMETGTGKTYVYIRTIAELHLKYGFRKFVIVVPSVAIREGVLNSLGLLKQHIRDIYDGLQYDHHVYDSNALTRVRQFATASHLQIMVVNIAAMTGDKENRIIHRPTDELNGYAPINFLQACRPIVIMDEPQSLDGPSQAKALETLNPLFRVGYSATPPDGAHLVYRLTPVDAYNQRLVKRIGVLSLVKDVDVNEAYVEVNKITATSASVTATATIHKATAQGTKPTKVTLHKDDDLFELSGGRDVYQGWVVEDILADLGDGPVPERADDLARRVELGVRRPAAAAAASSGRRSALREGTPTRPAASTAGDPREDQAAHAVLHREGRRLRAGWVEAADVVRGGVRAGPRDGQVPGPRDARRRRRPRRLLRCRPQGRGEGGQGRLQGRRRRVRADHAEEAGPARVRRAAPLHLQPLGARRRLGQPQRLHDLQPAGRQVDHAQAAAGRPRAAAAGDGSQR